MRHTTLQPVLLTPDQELTRRMPAAYPTGIGDAVEATTMERTTFSATSKIDVQQKPFWCLARLQDWADWLIFAAGESADPNSKSEIPY